MTEALREKLDAALSECAGFHIRFKDDRAQVIDAILPIIESELAEMREALRPFADQFERIEFGKRKFGPKDWPSDQTQFGLAVNFNQKYGEGEYFIYADLRRAHMLTLSPDKKDAGNA